MLKYGDDTELQEQKDLFNRMEKCGSGFDQQKRKLIYLTMT